MYRICLKTLVNYSTKPHVQIKPLQAVRLFGRQQAQAWTTRAQPRMSLKEKLMQPTSGLPFEIGRGVVIGASAVGLGALAFYGAGLSSQAGALERSMAWSPLVRERIRTTYAYFGAGILVSAASAAAIFRSPSMMRIFANSSIPATIATMVAVMGSSVLVQMLPYEPGLGGKQLAFFAHTALIGGIIAPLSFVGGQILVRAAMYTAGIVGGLSSIAACAPSEKFLSWGAPLGIGMGAVLAANIGSLFLPPTSALGAGLASIVVYGGLVLFSGFLLYDTQRIIKRAETTPLYSTRPFDPVNESLHVYMDVINIFIRMVMILAGGGNRKK